MKILVTGGAGFIGSHLVERLLREGHGVEILDDFDDFYDPRRKEANLASVPRNLPIHRIDIVDAEAVNRVIGQGNYDVIVHLAARAGVRGIHVTTEERAHIDAALKEEPAMAFKTAAAFKKALEEAS